MFGRWLSFVSAVALALLLILRADAAGAKDAENGVDFERHIAPILLDHCSACHNGSEHGGGLNLMTRATATGAGESGEPAIKPGDVDLSYAITRIESHEMPPKGKAKPISGDELATLKAWIAAGAPWPADRVLSPQERTTATRAGRDWWSLKPLADVAPPEVHDRAWPRGPIDAFVLAKLEANHLAPAPAAEKLTLLRRVTFDLTGLPPTPEEQAEFLADNSPDAYERVVDRLLASPHYGERWARLWLDVIRYGESHGFERDKPRTTAYRYRDWVIAAWNSDLPYNEFVRLQLAGDALKPDDPEAIIATGFLVAGPYDEVGQNQQSAAMKAVVREDEMEDLIGVTAQTFLGLTANCAHCHDHKFDPISQVDYYRLCSALSGVRHGERESLTPAGKAAAEERRQKFSAEIAERERLIAEIEEPVRKQIQAEQSKTAADAPAKSDSAKTEPPKIEQDAILVRLSPADRTKRDRWATELSWLELQRDLLAAGPVYAVAPKQPEPTHVLARGNPAAPGAVVAPGGIAAAASGGSDLGLDAKAPEAERRIKLAEWITGPAAPLAARVIVNRLWHDHFGVGIVDTPNDFGFNGGRPTHPELLDWLAGKLIAGGWRLKPLQREIVLSAAYRQSGRSLADGQKVDADNRLLWRKSPQRLEAEEIRDAILSAAGQLNPDVGGPSYRDFIVRENNATFYDPIDPVGYQFNRRTIYRCWVRSGTNRLLDVFDCPDPSTTTPRRLTTTTPLQALSLWNNSLVLRMADRFAERLEREAPGDRRRQIDLAYRLALARGEQPDELATAEAFIAAQGLPAYCRVLLNCNEFLYID